MELTPVLFSDVQLDEITNLFRSLEVQNESSSQKLDNAATNTIKKIIASIDEDVSLDGDAEFYCEMQDGLTTIIIKWSDFVDFDNDYTIDTNNEINNNTTATTNTTNETKTIADNNLGINGELDESFQQGQTGDCWLLASLLSLNSTKEGKEIIKNAINVNANGDVTVTLKGVGKTYTITAEELLQYDRNSALSDGDNDVLALEIAVAKYEQENYGSNMSYSSIISGGNPIYMTQLLTGKACTQAYTNLGTANQVNSSLSSLWQLYQNNNGNAVINFALSPGTSTAKCIDGSTFKLDLSEYHALSITNITANTVTIVNPWDSSKEYTMSWSEFAKLKLVQMTCTAL